MFARLQENQRVTVKLNWPAGSTLIRSLLLFVLLAALIEITARSSLVQKHIPLQAYGTNHIQFESQLKNLDAFVAKKGAPDCLILGNSQALRGIDPQKLEQAYQEQTGQTLLCYNFGVVGTDIATTFYFDQILIHKYHPRLVIVGTNFLDYTQGRENRLDPRFEENDWIHYELGQFSLQGWLLEHSYAFRLLKLFSYTAQDGLHFDRLEKEIASWNQQLTKYGYGYTPEIMDPSESMAKGSLRKFLRELGDFNLSRRNLDSLEGIIRLGQQDGVQVVVVEMPYHPSLLQLTSENRDLASQQERLSQFIVEVNTAIREIAARNHTVYWTSDQVEALPEDGWLDRYHLNTFGSPIFSRWLANQLATAVKSGQIANPISRN
ncbi:MAG: hypothetical protein AB1894_26365 [Chloroflexota bacterium]